MGLSHAQILIPRGVFASSFVEGPPISPGPPRICLLVWSSPKESDERRLRHMSQVFAQPVPGKPPSMDVPSGDDIRTPTWASTVASFDASALDGHDTEERS